MYYGFCGIELTDVDYDGPISLLFQNLKWFFIFSSRFFDKEYEAVVLEIPLCSGSLVEVAKVTFAAWVSDGSDGSLDAYMISFFG